MKSKRILAIILMLSFALAQISGSFAVYADNMKFTDLMVNGKPHWAASVINKLTSLGIISGYPDGSYKPEGSISRGEFTKLLVKALDLELTNRQSFDDIDNHWAKQYIETAVKERIIIPDEIGKNYRPDSSINRLEVAYMVARGLGIEAYQVWRPYKYPYIDTNDGLVVKLFMEYVLMGSLGKDDLRYFYPNSNLTRAEVATVIDRVIAYKADKTGYKDRQKEALEATFPKATPDAEFEAYMKSPDAENHASTTTFRVENGTVYFTEFSTWDYGDITPYYGRNKDLNKKLYNTLRDLVNIAKANDDYVECLFNQNAIVLKYREWGERGQVYSNEGNINCGILLYPEEDNSSKVSFKNIEYSWAVLNLYDSREIWGDDLNKIQCKQERFDNALKTMMLSMYGSIDGQKMYEYALKEYITERNAAPLYESRENYSRLNINGISIQNFNDAGNSVRFYTSIYKVIR